MDTNPNTFWALLWVLAMGLALEWLLRPWIAAGEPADEEEPGPDPRRDPGIETLLAWHECLETESGVVALGEARRNGVLWVYVDCLWWPNAFLLRRRLLRRGYAPEWRDVQSLWLSPQ